MVMGLVSRSEETAEGGLCECCQHLPQFEQILALLAPYQQPVNFHEAISANHLPHFLCDTSQEASNVEFNETLKQDRLGGEHVLDAEPVTARVSRIRFSCFGERRAESDQLLEELFPAE